MLQGPYAMNTFGGGVSCQGPTMSVAPFALGNFNGSQDPAAYQTHSGNFGISMGFNFPLDGSLQELCKESSRVEISRQKAIKNGITFHPDSPYHKICADVVVKYPSVKQAAASK